MKKISSAELTKRLRGRSCQIRREASIWRLHFDENLSILIECLWRLVAPKGLVVTNEDDGQIFGLPAPMDAEHHANRALDGLTVRKVEISPATSDLAVDFGKELQLEIIATSSGYEAWEMWLDGDLIVGHGGILL